MIAKLICKYMYILEFLWMKSFTFDVQMYSQTNEPYTNTFYKIPTAFTYELVLQSSNHNIQMFAN